MDSTVDSGNKVQKICDEIRKNTLEPALKEAEEIDLHAKKNAEQILVNAHEKKQQIIESAQVEIDKRKKIFENGLAIAKKRAIENIKDQVEKSLFNKAFFEEVSEATQTNEVLASIITALMKNVEKEGADASSLFLPSSCDAKSVAELVAKNGITDMEERVVLSDEIQGGVRLKLKEKNLTLDFSDEAITELIAKYIRKEFRELLFNC